MQHGFNFYVYFKNYKALGKRRNEEFHILINTEIKSLALPSKIPLSSFLLLFLGLHYVQSKEQGELPREMFFSPLVSHIQTESPVYNI